MYFQKEKIKFYSMYGQTEASQNVNTCVDKKIKLIVLEMQSTKINFI